MMTGIGKLTRFIAIQKSTYGGGGEEQPGHGTHDLREPAALVPGLFEFTGNQPSQIKHFVVL
jgi:hypothetical protein